MAIRKSQGAQVIYHDPKLRSTGWSGMAHPSGDWTIFAPGGGGVRKRGTSRNQKAAARAIRDWLAQNVK